MTQTELNNFIIKSKCCFANMANQLAINLSIGACDNYKELAILEDYIQQMQKYKLDDTDRNCIDEDQLSTIMANAKDICDLCDC